MRLVTKQEDPSWLSDFCELPSRIREGNAKVGMIPPVLWGQFLKMTDPAATQFWVAYDGGRAVGRVGASIVKGHEHTGAVGFFETDTKTANAEAIATALLSTAVEWLTVKGCTSFVGPMNLSTWFPYRFRVDNDERAFQWEPQNPPEYPAYFEKNGFAPFEHYRSVGSAGLQEFANGTATAWDRATAQGYTFRNWEGANLLEKEVPILYALSLEGFAGNFLFQPIPLELFRQLYVPIASKFDFSHSFFCVNPAGQEVGFAFSFVDGDALVLKSATVLATERGKGLSNALMHLGAKKALERGVSKYTSALMHVGNRSESYSKKGETLWTHQYTLYKK